VQGQDPSDPAARRSLTDVAQAVERPVELSLQKVDAFMQQQTQLLAQQQNHHTQEESVRAQRIVWLRSASLIRFDSWPGCCA
jgi:hypothetical protein